MTPRQTRLTNKKTYEASKIFGFIKSGANGIKRATLCKHRRSIRNL